MTMKNTLSSRQQSPTHGPLHHQRPLKCSNIILRSLSLGKRLARITLLHGCISLGSLDENHVMTPAPLESSLMF